MNKYYEGTQILEAYGMINSDLMAAKVDIWRLAALNKFGGVYLDEDIKVDMNTSSFDNLIGINDSIVLTTEQSLTLEVPTNSIYTKYRLGHPMRSALSLKFHDFPYSRIISFYFLISQPKHPFISKS